MNKPGSASVGHPVNVSSGVVYFRRLDASIRGSLAVNWLRNYSTSLLGQKGIHGWGWLALYSAELIRDGESFQFRHMEGIAGNFPDARARLFKGEVIRDLTSSAELSLERDVYVVCVWDVESGKIERYIFSEVAADGPFLLTGLENATGAVNTLSYDSKRRLVAVQQRQEGRTLGISYNTRQLVESISALDSNAWRSIAAYFYDAQDRLVKVENAVGIVEEYFYDAAGRVVAERSKRGAVYSFVYDNVGRCIHTSGSDGFDAKTLSFNENIGWTEVTNSIGHVSKYQWNERGQITNFISAAGEVSQTQYDEYGRISSRMFPGERQMVFEYDAEGNRKSLTDPLGRTVKFSFNKRHQVTELIDPLGKSWKSAYDAAGRWVGYRTPLDAEWHFDYDGDGKLIATTDPRGFRKQIRYQGDSRWDFSDYAGNVTSIEEDCLGRVVRRVSPSLKVTNYSRDPLGRLTGVDTSTGTNIQYQYDQGGNVSLIRDTFGAATTFRFGTCGRLAERTDRMGGKRKFRWGSEPGHLLEIIDETGATYKIEYDTVGRVSRETMFSGETISHEYDSSGFRSAFINEAGKKANFKRDAVGHLLAVDAVGATALEYEYDAAGAVIRAAVAGGPDITFVRDAQGRVVSEIQADIAVNYAFDAAGCLTELATTEGTNIVFGYDANAMPVAAQLNGQLLWKSRRDADRQEAERTWFDGALHLKQTFDPNGSLLSQTVDNGAGSSFLSRAFVYDLAGRLTVLKDSTWGETRYHYDAAEHVTDEITSYGEEHFSYDSAGNISAQLSGTSNVSYAYAAGNRLLEAGENKFEYDAQGRVEAEHRRVNKAVQPLTLSWSDNGKLNSVKSAGGEWHYRYDALGRRIEKTGPHGTTRFVWAGNLLLQELFSNGSSRTWVTQPGTFSPVAMVEGQKPFAIISDVTGSARDVVNSDGKLMWSARYGAWGELKSQRGELSDFPLRLPGQYCDPETNYHYSLFRYYDPRHGRFLSPDPIGLNGGLNEYGYGANTLGWIDPLGLILVYRNLRPDEDPANGLSAQQPGRDMAPAGHVMNGGKDNFKGSQYISTTTDPEVAEKWREDGQTQVSFDTDNVTPDSKGNLSIVDVSDREKAADAGLKGRALNYADNSKEVLVEGHVPPEALEVVPPKSEEEKEEEEKC